MRQFNPLARLRRPRQIFLFRFLEFLLIIIISRALSEGRFAIVTSVGCGMRWTQGIVRRAMLASPKPLGGGAALRTAKSRGSGAPGLALSLRVMILQATVTMRSRTPGRARSSR